MSPSSKVDYQVQVLHIPPCSGYFGFERYFLWAEKCYLLSVVLIPAFTTLLCQTTSHSAAGMGRWHPWGSLLVLYFNVHFLRNLHK
jgi:hypothetical protein